ncbi:alpha-beta hydrolase superfamily lysophospholipase [Hamadaea flava]|uniref:Alpha/beta hydrolase n=1 Tax=Hamadaea flava TaxID=1742688 RepID=A0ABV8LZX3_9ACTN|nr:alpha/beta fold hydrolase [Hamadaea flava]MCP2323512.1 alpha-beta hydrolase superfamily lysophospholipase [Hamadaea flava]
MSDQPRVTIREFTGRQPETEQALAGLSVESAAGLRQFSLERMLGYGVDYADAVELRGRVLAGDRWAEAATRLAEQCLQYAQAAAIEVVRAPFLLRASALLRMSQMMFLQDTAERREIYARAAVLYAEAAVILGDRERVNVDGPQGTLVGWWFHATPQPVGTVVVIGGVEGWAMDFASMGLALAQRNLNVLVLDGPGQGETRFTHGQYLTAEWRASYGAVLDYVQKRAPGVPIGLVGNSMGGSLMMAIAVADERIRACCDNGGLVAPSMVTSSVGTFHTKMVLFCGTSDPDAAARIWTDVNPIADGPNTGYPLLIVHGSKDPLISDDLATAMLTHAPTADKEMTVFSDGDHCIYNHLQDRDALIGDWMRARLATAGE